MNRSSQPECSYHTVCSQMLSLLPVTPTSMSRQRGIIERDASRCKTFNPWEDLLQSRRKDSVHPTWRPAQELVSLCCRSEEFPLQVILENFLGRSLNPKERENKHKGKQDELIRIIRENTTDKKLCKN